MATDLMIQFDGVSKTYGQGHTAVQALDSISLKIPQGTFWAIMGPSGSGKSTLLHLVGLLDRPSHGSLTIGLETIEPTSNLSHLARIRRTLIGFVFQQFFLLPRLSARDNVCLPGLYAGLTKREADKRASQLLAQVDMMSRADHQPNQLSGGEQQRVAIARALMNDPAIILADEPTGNLDSASGAIVLKLLSQLHGTGKTILLVTHDPKIGQQAEKIVRLEDGRLDD